MHAAELARGQTLATVQLMIGQVFAATQIPFA
jgi:hypothetical protein